MQTFLLTFFGIGIYIDSLVTALLCHLSQVSEKSSSSSLPCSGSTLTILGSTLYGIFGSTSSGIFGFTGTETDINNMATNGDKVYELVAPVGEQGQPAPSSENEMIMGPGVPAPDVQYFNSMISAIERTAHRSTHRAFCLKGLDR